jgi:hypothetical protein
LKTAHCVKITCLKKYEAYLDKPEVQEKILPLYENLKKNPLVISEEMLKKLNIPTNKGGGENLYK